MKERCKPQIEQYERCLKGNAAHPEACTGQLKKLYACSEGKLDAPVESVSHMHPPGCDCGQHEKHGAR